MPPFALLSLIIGILVIVIVTILFRAHSLEYSIKRIEPEIKVSDQNEECHSAQRPAPSIQEEIRSTRPRLRWMLWPRQLPSLQCDDLHYMCLDGEAIARPLAGSPVVHVVPRNLVCVQGILFPVVGIDASLTYSGRPLRDFRNSILHSFVSQEDLRIVFLTIRRTLDGHIRIWLEACVRWKQRLFEMFITFVNLPSFLRRNA
jgi:hypothetical protein